MSEVVDKPFIHFHIPKTAGTSLRAAFIKEFSPEGVAFRLYDGRLVRTSDLPFTNTERLDRVRRLARGVGMLNIYSAALGHINNRTITDSFDISTLESRNIQVATGHFTPEDIPEEISHLPRTTILRDPLARARSHYAHWREAKGNMWWHSGGVPYADSVTFETFATDPALANYHTKYLGSLSFAAIGTTANLPEFFRNIGLDSEASIPTLNPGRYREMPSLDPGFVRDFIEMNSVDYELYEAAASVQ